jgi:hypothetical protein
VTLAKWGILVTGLIAAYPFGLALRAQPRLLTAVWTLVGLLPFLGSPDIDLHSLGRFPGDTHGFAVSVLDFLALSLLYSRRASSRQVPYRKAMGTYLLVAAFSATQALSPVASLSYSWRLLRFYLLFAAVVRGARTFEASKTILRGMAIGVYYEFFLTMHQRLSVYQSSGSFSHQNSLGMAMNLVLMAPMALILATKADWVIVGTPFAGLVAVVLTRSRGSLIFFALGVFLVYWLSLARSPKPRKLTIGVAAGTVALVVLARAAPRIAERFETAPAESMEARRQFAEAATMMLHDHPLGVGANHFAWSLEGDGYSDRVGLRYANRRAIVHNVYWLTAAELGYPGIVALIALLLSPLVDAIRSTLVARPGDPRGDLLLGLGVSLVICYLHSTVEWIWRATDVSYVFWTVVGLVGAVSGQIRRRSQRPAGRRLRAQARWEDAERSRSPILRQLGAP